MSPWPPGSGLGPFSRAVTQSTNCLACEAPSMAQGRRTDLARTTDSHWKFLPPRLSQWPWSSSSEPRDSEQGHQRPEKLWSSTSGPLLFSPNFLVSPKEKQLRGARAGSGARARNDCMSMPPRKCGILVHEYITGATPRTLDLLGNWEKLSWAERTWMPGTYFEHQGNWSPGKF